MGTEWDDFSERKPFCDVALVVEDRKFWLSRGALAMLSPVFSNMFYGEFSESKKEEIELPDKKADDILELLRCLFPTNRIKKKVDYENVVVLFKLADEYQIAYLSHCCSEFLVRLTEGHPLLKEVLKEADRLRQKSILRLVVPLIARFELSDLQPTLDKVQDKVRSAVLFQMLGQIRFHVPVTGGLFNQDCRLCGLNIVNGPNKAPAELLRCDRCPICRKTVTMASADCCRCLCPMAMAELEKIDL